MDQIMTETSPSYYQQMLTMAADCRAGLERLAEIKHKGYVRLGNPVAADNSYPLAIVLKRGRVYGEYLKDGFFPRIELRPLAIDQVPFEHYPSVAALNKVAETIGNLYNKSNKGGPVTRN